MTTTLPSNPQDNAGPQILTLALVFTLFSVLVVLIRLYVRVFVIHNVGWDDGVMSFAVVLSTAGLGLVIGQVLHGAGRHIGDLDAEDVLIGLKLNFISQVVFLVAICVCKLSVGFLLRRIASTKFWKHLITGFMIFIFVYTTAGFCTLLLQCTDIRTIWDFTVSSTCWSARTIRGLSYANFSLNIVSDVTFAIFIPAPMLWGLKVNKRTRLTLLGILGLGLLVCACAVVRITYVGSFTQFGDLLWNSRNLTNWSVMELNVGIIAGSLPSLRPLMSQFLGTVTGTGSRSRSPKSGYYERSNGTKRMSQTTRQSLSIRPGAEQGLRDDKSSEPARHGLDNKDQIRNHPGPRGYVTIVTAAGSKRSSAIQTLGEGSVGAEDSDMAVPASGGIMKTTTTTLTYHDPKETV